jgi:hypothetical protein
MRKDLKTFSETVHKAIKKHGGLSDWDDDAIAYEVEAIVRAVKRAGFVITKGERPEPKEWR